MTFLLENSGYIYLYHWFTPTTKFKISTGIKIDKNQWNSTKQRAKGNKLTYKGKNVNAQLSSFEDTFNRVFLHCENNDCLTLENFRKMFREELGRPIIKKRKVVNKNKSFNEYFKSVVVRKKAEGASNWKSYNTTFNHFLIFAKGKDYSFDKIDSKFYHDFNTYLLGTGIAKNTISERWKMVKAVMNLAFKEKMHSSTDYRQFKRNKESTDSIYLSRKEIKNIEDLDLDGTDNVVRDYFIIGCYTGLRYSDWDKVSADVIKDKMLIIRSAKTGEKSVIPVHDKVMEILNKYNGKLPDKPTDVTVNKRIKEIGKLAGIDDSISKRITKGGHVVTNKKKKYELITSHTARRSFATNLVLEGKEASLVMKITGHKTLEEFQKYIRFDDLVATKQLQKLDFFK